MVEVEAVATMMAVTVVVAVKVVAFTALVTPFIAMMPSLCLTMSR